MIRALATAVVLLVSTVISFGSWTYLPVIMADADVGAPPLITGTPTVTATATSTVVPEADVSISQINSDGNPEYVRVSNLGTAQQNMTGWWLQSYRGSDCSPLSSQIYHFPVGYVLAPGASVQVLSGSSASDEPREHLLWTTKFIWANGGDVADLRDGAGSLIDSWRYGDCR